MKSTAPVIPITTRVSISILIGPMHPGFSGSGQLSSWSTASTIFTTDMHMQAALAAEAARPTRLPVRATSPDRAFNVPAEAVSSVPADLVEAAEAAGAVEAAEVVGAAEAAGAVEAAEAAALVE